MQIHQSERRRTGTKANMFGHVWTLEFQQWHASLKTSGYTFHLIRDMKKYCESDVKLLKAGCQKFVAEFKTVAGFDPLEKCITIASACNRYWRKRHLTPPRMVAVQPPNGWKGCQTNQSFQAHQWLSWYNHRLRADTTSQDRIRHVHNGGEVRLEGELVDGYDASTRTVYEYNGCFFHGCPDCFPKNRVSTVSRLRSDRTMQECFKATLIKRKKLESAGYTVVTKWECQWLRDMKDNETLRSFVDRHLPISPLEPRDAFFGGRTNAVKLHHRVIEGETIRYQDVTSLYPWVNKYAEFPTGHPHIITGIEHTDMSEYFGVAKITIIPPFGLLHPVLPLRSGGKLTFPLCRTCVEMEMVKPLLERSCICPHSDAEERALTGTWCTPEIMEAVSQQYTIVKIHEVWHFPTEQRRRSLFSSYVNTWLRIKTEASGYPHWATTPEEKQRYRENYHHREGIALDPSLIVKNPGRKATAKLMLNSFWGKFGENLRKSSTQIINSPAQLYSLVSDPLKIVTGLRICNEDTMEVVYTSHDEECVENGKTNLFVAAFTTCHARLKLYSYLKTLGDQVLYFDTDSVIYSHKPGQAELDNGDYLGDLTNALYPGDHIVDFTSGGPKNYGYITSRGKVECKVRGFTLGNVRGSRHTTFFAKTSWTNSRIPWRRDASWMSPTPISSHVILPQKK